MDASERLQKATRIVRTALAELLDQSKPFGRLAMLQTLISAGSTAVAVGLADSVFFSVSPKEAEAKVLLYLLLTVAPFAVVAPALAPLLDRGRQARRTAMAITAVLSALFCVLMAQNYGTKWLYPEAFGILVLSKLYLVTKAAITPAIAPDDRELASVNAKLAVLAALAGFAISPIAIGFLQLGAAWVMSLAAIIYVTAIAAAVRLPRLGETTADAKRRLAGRQRFTTRAHTARAGSRPTATRRAEVAPEYAEPPLGFAEGRPLYGPPPPGGDRLLGVQGPAIARVRKGMAMPRYAPEVLVALTAMSVVRGSVGFVTFFLAFALKHSNAKTWLYGVILLTSGIGGLAGSMIVPRLRRNLSEQRIILYSLVVGAIFAVITGIIGGLWAQPLLTFVIGLAGTTAKPAFDSLVQRNVTPLAQGRAFARFETRLQLVWVLAALIAVLVKFSFGAGDLVVAVACGIAAVFYGSMRHTFQAHEGQLGDVARPRDDVARPRDLGNAPATYQP
ncbi:MAG TPA: MFS transporter [Acidimicrobiales bacterium]|nr:MFS transporter [Acidimicrobiales bacterium]